MPKYVLKFKKQGLIKYTSHLDMLRLFKRSIKASGIPLEYSNGFNPHPKMAFAQPLSLGFTSSCEYLEFTSKEALREEISLGRLRDEMPEGIELISLSVTDNPKTLASLVTSATYIATLPLQYQARGDEIKEKIKLFLEQPSIITLKREKKSKKYIEKDIKKQIENIDIVDSNDRIALVIKVDAGSSSNLNPLLVINAFSDFAGITLDNGDVDIERREIYFEE